MNGAQQVLQCRLDRRMLTVTSNACGKKALQTKAAAHARHRPTFGADARFSLKMERNRTARRTHERALRIDRGLIVANFNFHRFPEKLFTTQPASGIMQRRTKNAHRNGFATRAAGVFAPQTNLIRFWLGTYSAALNAAQR